MDRLAVLQPISGRRGCTVSLGTRLRLAHSRRWQLVPTAILIFLVGLATIPLHGQNSSPAPASNCTTTDPIVGLPNLDLVKKKLIAYHDCVGDAGCYATLQVHSRIVPNSH